MHFGDRFQPSDKIADRGRAAERENNERTLAHGSSGKETRKKLGSLQNKRERQGRTSTKGTFSNLVATLEEREAAFI